jgi:uncharacterized delta-60 repeat protein
MRYILGCLCLQFFLHLTLCAQDFDPNFGPILKGTGQIWSLDETEDGNFIAVGSIDYIENEPCGRVIKFDHQGNFLAGFNKVYTDKLVRKVISTFDGKILIQGDFTQVNGNPAHNLARLNSDGSFDPTFIADTSLPIGDFELQADGKIIIHPKFKGPAVVHRLMSTGAKDDTFASPALPLPIISSFAIDGSDRIIVSSPDDVIRLTSNGTIDATYAVNSSPVGGQILSLAAQADGKVLVGGTFTEFYGVSRNGLIRLRSDGSLDSDFIGNPDEVGTSVIELLEDGSILTSGNLNNIYKFSSSGGSKEIIANVYPNMIADICETSMNQLLVGGEFRTLQGYSQPSIGLLNSNNTFNNNFRPNVFSAPQAGGRDMGISNGGKIILGGFDSNFTAIGNISTTLVQLNTDGTLDESFTTPLLDNSMIFALEVQQNKKILISGYLNFGATSQSFARLNSDGSYDTEFNDGGTGMNGVAQRIRFNGADIFVAGNFSHYNGVPSQSFIILNHKGEIKQTFNVFSEFTTLVDFDIQSDGKIIVVGAIQLPGGLLKGMVRLNQNGTLDETFVPKNFDNFSAIKIDGEDRIYVGGSLATFQPSILIRFLPDGTFDENFTNGLNFTLEGEGVKQVTLIDILPSRKLVVGGNFDYYKDKEANGLVIFDKDGSTYTVATGLSPSSIITRMKYHGSHIYVGGRLAFDDGIKVIGLGKIKLNTLEFVDPDAPQEFAFRPVSGDDLIIEWHDNTDAEDGYEIERLNEDTQLFEPIEQTSSNYTALVDSSANATSSTNYRIRAFNAAGNSDYVYIKEYDFPEPPIAPTNLTLLLANDKITVSWTDASINETGFILQKSLLNTSSFTQLAQLGPNGNVYEDNQFEPGQLIYYQVAAINDGGSSDFTQASIAIPELPTAPTNLSLTPTNNNTLILSWTDASENEDGFIIEKSIENASTFEEIASVDQNTVTYEDELLDNHTVFYQVAAFNAAGTSNFVQTSYTITNIESEHYTEVSVFPNPASGNVHIKTEEIVLTISLVSPLNQFIKVPYQTIEGGLLIDLSVVPIGFYYIRIETINGRVQHASLIKR